VGFRFQKRISLGPFARINLSKSGASLSVGERGAHLTLGKTPRVTVGLPGSGLSYTQTLPRGRSRSAGGVLAFVVQALALMLGAAIGLGILAMIVSGG
jgi:hypothetical protein